MLRCSPKKTIIIVLYCSHTHTHTHTHTHIHTQCAQQPNFKINSHDKPPLQLWLQCI